MWLYLSEIGLGVLLGGTIGRIILNLGKGSCERHSPQHRRKRTRGPCRR